MRKRAPAFALLAALMVAVGSLAATPSPSPSPRPAPVVRIGEFAGGWFVLVSHKGAYSDHNKVIAALRHEIETQKVKVTGPLTGFYHSNPMEVAERDLRWDLGFEVKTPRKVKAPLLLVQQKKRTAATSEHRGSYESVGDTVFAIYEWASGNGWEPEFPLIERFTGGDPGSAAATDLRAEVFMPVRRKTATAP